MGKITWQDFGGFLQGVRRQRGLSQATLAAVMEYDRIHIWRLEHGQRHPSRQFLHLLMDAITLTPAETQRLAAFRQMILYRCGPAESAQSDGQKEGRAETWSLVEPLRLWPRSRASTAHGASSPAALARPAPSRRLPRQCACHRATRPMLLHYLTLHSRRGAGR
jgi:transcriptional regulator with XRE-family HTH domain